MSYPRDLDEYTTQELLVELARREGCQRAGACDYCRRHRTADPCKFPERHTREAVLLAGAGAP